jgi:hypothetical protein
VTVFHAERQCKRARLVRKIDPTGFFEERTQDDRDLAIPLSSTHKPSAVCSYPTPRKITNPHMSACRSRQKPLIRSARPRRAASPAISLVGFIFIFFSFSRCTQTPKKINHPPRARPLPSSAPVNSRVARASHSKSQTLIMRGCTMYVCVLYVDRGKKKSSDWRR